MKTTVFYLDLPVLWSYTAGRNMQSSQTWSKIVVGLLTEEDKVRIYYNVENARVYRSAGPNYVEITAEMAPAVEFLINTYPEYTNIDSLPLENVADQINIASLLYEKGLLITGEPLQPMYDEPGKDSDDTDDQL
ncbi:hypothetical protein RRG08_001503 [Elysia crispata]|uniref:RIOX1/NO66-like C-terminal winged helix domain-containing protein n=1 Tax=Elysia crispata TaxID=231223 RepID=A0AAE1AAZ7_9GAST|nr:hypothetical protein RRG08_001503 [Elysia crispata]